MLSENVAQLFPLGIDDSGIGRRRRLIAWQAERENVRLGRKAVDFVHLGQALWVIWVGAGKVEDTIQSLVPSVPAVAADDGGSCIIVGLVEEGCHEKLVHSDG